MPNKITFDQNKIIEYVYNSAGIKLQQIVSEKDGAQFAVTHYVGEFIYKNNELSYILTPEGRITFDNTGGLNYLSTPPDSLLHDTLTTRLLNNSTVTIH